MSLNEYLAALRKRWYLLVVVALLGALAGFGYAHTKPTEYKATSKVFVSLSRGSTAQELVQGTTYTQNLIQSYAELATLPVVLNPVLDRLGMEGSVKSLSHSVTASNPLNTVIVQIAATAGTGARAADIANAVAEQLSSTITELSPSTSEGDAVQVRVVAPADVPGFPFEPRTRLLTLTGLVAGLLLGIVLALVRTLLDTRLRSADDVSSVTDAPMLGAIPGLGRRRTDSVAAMAPQSVVAEAYRRLQTNLQFLDASAQLRAVVVTSSLGGEGKSTTSINLAVAIAEKGRRVLLVDADMRRPSIADYCNLEGDAGLTTVLIGKAEVEDVVQKWALPSLDVLTLGELPPNPSQLIGSPRMEHLLKELRDSYDVVVLDSPPLLPVADAAILARLTDGALVVANCRKIHRHQFVDALETLDAVDARCLGVVTNQVRSGTEQKYYGRTKQRHPVVARLLRPLQVLSRRRGTDGSSATATSL